MILSTCRGHLERMVFLNFRFNDRILISVSMIGYREHACRGHLERMGFLNFRFNDP